MVGVGLHLGLVDLELMSGHLCTGDGGEDKTIEEEGAASDVDDVSMDDAEPSGSDEEPEAEEAAQEPDQGYASRKRSSDEAGISGGPGGSESLPLYMFLNPAGSIAGNVAQM